MRALSVAPERPNATTNAPYADFVLQLEAIVDMSTRIHPSLTVAALPLFSVLVSWRALW